MNNGLYERAINKITELQQQIETEEAKILAMMNKNQHKNNLCHNDYEMKSFKCA